MTHVIVDVMVWTNPFASAAVLRGVAEYARAQGNWRFVAHPGDEWHARNTLVNSPSRGIIAYVTTEKIGRFVQALGKPTVNLHGGVPQECLPGVVPDEHAIGAIGAGHLLERGYKNFAFLGNDGAWSRGREEGFAETLRAAGVNDHQTTAPPDRPTQRRTWMEHIDEGFLRDWVRRFRTPTGVMACCDEVSALLLDACLDIGLRVPEDAAIIGVDNDELQCVFQQVALSSVDPNLERLGFEAGRLLDRLMAGEAPPERPVLVRPRGLVERRSTDALAFADRDLTEAVRLIRARACDGLSVGDVLRHVAVSRSTLERRFKEELGRTAADEIRRVRLERARELLIDTDFDLVDICARTGFEYLSHLSHAFKTCYGLPPGRYRQQHKRR